MQVQKHQDSNNKESEIQHLGKAQEDMQNAYRNGYPGAIASGIIWLISGIVIVVSSPERGMWTLLIGGVFIHPIGVLLDKAFGASGAHTTNNPLARLAMEGTIFMLMCMPLAYMLSFQKIEWFFQAMLLIIGGRYLTFSTLYGNRAYWALGLGLGMVAFLLIAFNIAASVSVFCGSAIEIGFGVIMMLSTPHSPAKAAGS